MPITIRTASMALAASGLALAMPASAALPAHAAPQAQVNAQATDVLGPMTAEHKKKKRKHWKRGDRHYHGQRYVVRQAPRYRDTRPYYMSYPSNYGQPVYAHTRVWRGNDNRYYCRRDNGTTGLLVGAGVGALLGHEVAGRGDGTLGAILGGAAGALLGRSIDRSNTRCG